MYPFVMHSSIAPYLASNSGYLDGYENVTVPRGNVARVGDPNYRGQVYLQNSPSPVKIHRWTMSSIEVEFDAKGPDLLVVNQNYFNGWKVREAGRTTKAIRTLDGLLAVDVGPGHHRLRVYYLPDSFLIGAIISACAVIGGVVFLIDERRRSTR